ncbi:MAG: nucleotidyltransferase family protein, partial [Patescibacteria group bacterium]|nr:nucleotidyltransferase family protein [Patescibacteria group bacterium]
MKAVILAAGEGTRLRPLTNDTPKAMIKLAGKPIVQHALENLPEEINEIIFVVNYKKEQIINYFGESFGDKKITYVEQDSLNGSAGAVDLCRNLIDSKFLVLMGDNIYSKKDIKKCLKYNNCILVIEKNGPITGGNIVIDREDRLKSIKEGVHDGKVLINTALYVISPEYFNYEMVEWKKGEFGLPQTLVKMSQDH